MDGEQLGHFALLEKIGEGGMGRVYKARDTRLARLVAIKLLPEAKLTDPDRRARFVHEARTASALNHPNIVTVYEIDQANGTDFIAMEYVEGKPLDELIGRKGLKINEALKCAVQIADALAKAHSAGIVHRDLKPGNVMVTEEGRVKVLDFGLAKLTEPAEIGADVSTRTMKPATEEGKILGTVAYMSPEQAEGKKLDARSDIFSFGAVLYEMLTGRRAFQKESKTSTLAAIIHAEPEPLGREVPQELSRLIRRCLRKDAERRFQHMADVSVALAELKDESDSGQLSSAETTARPPRRRFLWPAVGMACVALAAAALVWTYLNRGSGVATQGPDLVRLSPDDGYSYASPSISADGKFVAYVSDRGGSRQVWLQQVAGGNPIQLTHSADPVLGTRFFPDGTRLLYGASSADGKSSSFAVIPTLGGEPRVLASTNPMYYGALSPDGRQGAYLESESPDPSARVRLMVRSLDSGQPRELSSWTSILPARNSGMSFAWTSDSRYLLCVGSKRSDDLNYDEWEWFALPVEGGSPRATGVGDALRAVGLKLSYPLVVAGDRVLFGGGKSERINVWEVRLSPDSWRVRGTPRQLTFGTENQLPLSVSASGMLAMQIFRLSADLYLLPLSPASGQPVGVLRRLTHDGRLKTWMGVGGDPGSAYFRVQDIASKSWSGYALGLETGKQTLVVPKNVSGWNVAVSPDGRQVAYSIPEGNSFSIRIADAGAAPGAGRLICTACGRALRFSRDGRFLFLRPEATVRPDPKRKYTIRLLEVASGKDTPWLEHPTGSIMGIGTFGQDLDWVMVPLGAVGSQGQPRPYLVPWREEPVPLAEWIEVKMPPDNTYWASSGNFFQFLQGGKLMAIRFDPQTRALSDPYEVKYPSGSGVTLSPNDSWVLRSPGLVFSRQETTSSVWLMKLPR